ncbi:unnamed protein product [Phytomonas sp. EM1]|nr:unnamed protein product [Phytomonas sp. EM1]|eukprot:CCW59569.1 unnamed protein product [Phytomonas sp. isolate EM1]
MTAKFINQDLYGELCFLCTHVGTAAAKAMLAAAMVEKVAPKFLSEAITSSGIARKCVQGEVVRLILVRVSLNQPEYLAWLIRVVSDYLASHPAEEVLASVGKSTITGQVLTFGLKGNLASATATAAIQASIETCRLLTGRLRWRRPASKRISFAQYRYNMTTLACTGLGTVVGGSVGAALGTMILPGFGTILGSLVCSCSGGWLPGYLRHQKSPDRYREQHQKELANAPSLCMRITQDDFVELSQRTTDVSVGSITSLSSEEAPCHDADDDGAVNRAASMEDNVFAEDTCLLLRSRQPTAKPSGDTSQEKEVEINVCADGSPFTINAPKCIALAGKLEDLGEVQDWDDVNKRINKHGENEMFLFFSVNK